MLLNKSNEPAPISMTPHWLNIWYGDKIIDGMVIIKSINPEGWLVTDGLNHLSRKLQWNYLSGKSFDFTKQHCFETPVLGLEAFKKWMFGDGPDDGYDWELVNCNYPADRLTLKIRERKNA